jgi:hypothetical protein
MNYAMLVAASLLLLLISACGKEPGAKDAAGQGAAVPGASAISITAPADGDRVSSKAEIQVDYDITIGGDGDHAHLYADDRRLAMLRKMRGSYVIFPQDPGVHEICIKVVNSNHMPTGVTKCVKVEVE